MILCSRPRVLHVITRMVCGGAQEVALAMARGIRELGWETALVTGPALGPEGSLEPECFAAGLRVVRLPHLVREIAPASDLRAFRALTALFRKERPHVVHTHTSKAGVLGRLAARRTGVPVVVHSPHGHVFHGYGGPCASALFRAIERSCARLADRIVTVTEQERREHLAFRIAEPERFVTIPNGVDFAPFDAARGLRSQVRAELGIPENAPIVGCVARLAPVKGHRFLLEAAARVAREVPDLRLLLVGDGVLRGELEEHARRLGIRTRVLFLGLRKDIPRLLSAMDLFALPSLNEGMGIALVEAMAMELPCVASRVGGICDVVADGETGLLVPPGDPETLADALTTLLRDPERARRMGRAGRRRVVPAYSAERMLERVQALYVSLLEEKGIRTQPAQPAVPEAAAAVRRGPGTEGE